jgi:hypothetical protein
VIAAAKDSPNPSGKKKTVVAHLGAHKTATSLVQKYFREKKKYYADQGVACLTRSEISPFISWGDRVIEDPSVLAKGIKKKTRKSTGSTILFSNENALGKPLRDKPGLYPSHAKIIPAFAKALNDFQPRIVYSIRPQWEFLESYYLQMVHQGYFLTFNQFIDEIDLTQLQWSPIIDRLNETFGKENVIVLDFGLIRQGQDVFLADFIKRCISPNVKPDLEYDEVHNASISDRGLQMALRINPLLKAGETGVVRRFLQANFSNLTEPRPTLMSEKMKARYQDEYTELVKKSD